MQYEQGKEARKQDGKEIGGESSYLSLLFLGISAERAKGSQEAAQILRADEDIAGICNQRI